MEVELAVCCLAQQFAADLLTLSDADLTGAKIVVRPTVIRAFKPIWILYVRAAIDIRHVALLRSCEGIVVEVDALARRLGTALK